MLLPFHLLEREEIEIGASSLCRIEEELSLVDCDVFDLQMERQENFVVGRAGNESILIFVYLGADQTHVTVTDILTNGLLIAKASQGEKWVCRLDYFFDSSPEVILLGYSVNRHCISKLYHFHIPLILADTVLCSSPLDVALLPGIASLSLLK